MITDETRSAAQPVAYQKVHGRITDESLSPLRRYQEIVVGSRRIGFTVGFELLTGMLGSVPGAAGLFLRKSLYPLLLGEIAGPAVFGVGVTLCHPRRIRFGSGVVVADGCVLDARGGEEVAMGVGDDCVLGRRSHNDAPPPDPR